MKKVFITALIAVSFASTGFASNGLKLNTRTLSNFEKDFKAARDVQWSA